MFSKTRTWYNSGKWLGLFLSLREENLESWIYGSKKILWYKFYLSLFCDLRFCFSLHKTVGMLWRKQYFIDRYLPLCISSFPSFILWNSDGLCIASWSAAQPQVWEKKTEQYLASYIFLNRYHLVSKDISFLD